MHRFVTITTIKIGNCSITVNLLCAIFYATPSPPLTPDNHLYVLISIILSQQYYINGIIQNATFFDWLFPEGINPLRANQVLVFFHCGIPFNCCIVF